MYGNRLTEYEKTEIEKYSKIWYLGLDACKIHGEQGGSQNGGYDDDSGSYNKVSVKTIKTNNKFNLKSHEKTKNEMLIIMNQIAGEKI